MGRKKLTIEEMQTIAKSRGGKCLSKKYVNKSTKLEWECSKGHRWFASPNNVKNNNTWCDGCGGNKKLTIEEMQAIAESRGGKCHSKNYIDANTKLRWECAEGHRWNAIPNSVKRGTWCGKCYRQSRRKTV